MGQEERAKGGFFFRSWSPVRSSYTRKLVDHKRFILFSSFDIPCIVTWRPELVEGNTLWFKPGRTQSLADVFRGRLSVYRHVD